MERDAAIAQGAAWRRETPHGLLVALPLPSLEDTSALARLYAELAPEEALRLPRYAPSRQRTFAGGRSVLRMALLALGHPHPGAIPSDERGAPTVSQGVRASISHKDDVACALVSKSTAGHIGVDVEGIGLVSDQVAPRILSMTELAAIERGPQAERALARARSMALKEALYKAVDPYVRRFVDFHEAHVTAHDDFTASLELRPTQGEGPFAISAGWFTRGQHVYAHVEVRRG